MTRLTSQAGDAFAQPGMVSFGLLGVGQLPRLLSIIIRVAVPGPA